MQSVALFYCHAECRYPECHDAECHYAECRGTYKETRDYIVHQPLPQTSEQA
jgi:hypothetical protein